MTAEREQAYAAAEVAYDNANHSDIYANPGPLRAAVDAVWDLAVAEGRRQAADAIRAEVERGKGRGNHTWGFAWGMDCAARIAEGGAP